MTREQYLEKVIALYLATPDTPAEPRRGDWAVATTFYQQDVPITDIAHALRLCTLRRIKRDPKLPPLERICSLAYIREMVGRLRRQPHPEGYYEYVHWSYLREIEARARTAQHRRNPAVSDRR